MLEPILELSGLSFQLAHVKIIAQKSGYLLTYPEAYRKGKWLPLE